METKPKTELATQPEGGNNLQTVNLQTGNLPDLKEAQEMPIELTSDYWTPEAPGESKRVYFEKVGKSLAKSFESEDVIELDCAFFLEQVGTGADKKIRRISNGSSRLVSSILGNKIEPGTPLLITYIGKKKNKTNSFSSDVWSIKPLIIKLS